MKKKAEIGTGITVILMMIWFSGGCGQVAPGEEGAVGQLDHDIFKSSVQPILDTRGCSQQGCHFRDKSNPNSGGPGGSLRIFNCTGNSCTDSQLLANDDSASGMANITDPVNSKLLTKALAEAAGGVQHLGGNIFLSTTDPDYITLLSWIQNPV